MSLSSRALGYLPRRSEGLPPGQREVQLFPRFSDQPLRWAPPVESIELKLAVEGVEHEVIDAKRLEEFEMVERSYDFHCVTTWTYRNVQWRGVLLNDVLAAEFGIGFADELPPYAVASAGDRQACTFVGEDLFDPTVLLATGMQGLPLTRRHGAPLRLVTPLQYGYKNAKHLVEINFVSSEPEGTFGAKEHLRARVAHEERHSRLPARLLRAPYRLTVVPTALAADRGLKKSP